MGNAICVLQFLLVLIHNICLSPKRNGLSDTNYALFETVRLQLLYSFLPDNVKIKSWALTLYFSVEVADGPSLPREPEEPDSLPLIRTYPPPGHQPLSLPCFASLPGQSAVTTDSISRELTRRGRNKCSVVNCRNPASLSHLKCKHCCRTFCLSCSVQSSPCPKNPLGSHSFVPNFSKTHLPRSPKKRVEVKKARKEEVFPWECKRCTMLNGPQVLVCLGCEKLRETEAQEERNVCPMCTLVNEPGKTKCELCDTLLVKQEEHSSPDD